MNMFDKITIGNEELNVSGYYKRDGDTIVIISKEAKPYFDRLFKARKHIHSIKFTKDSKLMGIHGNRYMVEFNGSKDHTYLSINEKLKR